MNVPLSYACLSVYLSVCLFVHCIALSGLVRPSLTAKRNPSGPSSFSGKFPTGWKTTVLRPMLPACVVEHRAGRFLQLYNEKTGLVSGHHGKFDNTATANNARTTVQWDTSTYPVLNKAMTGSYRCRTDTGTSVFTYQLDVV